MATVMAEDICTVAAGAITTAGAEATITAGAEVTITVGTNRIPLFQKMLFKAGRLGWRPVLCCVRYGRNYAGKARPIQPNPGTAWISIVITTITMNTPPA
jgi:hypothetical protein